MATVYSASQQVAPAKELLHKASSILRDLVADHPKEPAYREQLTYTLNSTAVLCNSARQPREAEEAYQQLIDLLRENVTSNPRGDDLNWLAWTLVDCPIVAVRNPAEAIPLAKQAVASAPSTGKYWNTLGVAYYRAGDYQSAVATLEESVKRGEGGTAWDFFFLAMAQKHLGNITEASRWYEKAVSRMEKNAPLHGDLLRYRAEADSLLGMKREKN
jgi:tetratricopeptide (TPR) repeat protein